MRTLILSFFLIISNISNSHANCTASFMSSPDSIFGQTFNCDDGSTLTYNNNSIFGDSITNNSTGETYTGSFLSTTSDEYNGLFGRSFDSNSGSLNLQRNSIFGDTISID